MLVEERTACCLPRALAGLLIDRRLQEDFIMNMMNVAVSGIKIAH